MIDFTPTEDDLRHTYASNASELAEFDRAIAKIKADAIREAANPFLESCDIWEREIGRLLERRAAEIEESAK